MPQKTEIIVKYIPSGKLIEFQKTIVYERLQYGGRQRSVVLLVNGF